MKATLVTTLLALFASVGASAVQPRGCGAVPLQGQNLEEVDAYGTQAWAVLLERQACVVGDTA